MADEEKMTIVEHLEELRLRIIYSISAWAIASSGSYFLAPGIISLFTRMINTKLVFINPSEAFFAYFKIAMLLGLFISLPVILYNILVFIIPGLERNEKKWVLRLVPFSIILFACGMLFAYFTVIPVTLKFFLSFKTENLEPMITIGSFISFVLTLLIICGLMFQTPLVILFLSLIGIVNSKTLRESRKYVILAFIIIAAIATPTPDAFTQIVVTIPMVILYELSILFVRIIERKPAKHKNN